MKKIILNIIEDNNLNSQQKVDSIMLAFSDFLNTTIPEIVKNSLGISK